jgi:hypothetical protein
LIGPPRTPGSVCDNAAPGNASAAENTTEAIARSFFIRLSLKLLHVFYGAARRGRSVMVLAARDAPAATKND